MLNRNRFLDKCGYLVGSAVSVGNTFSMVSGAVNENLPVKELQDALLSDSKYFWLTFFNFFHILDVFVKRRENEVASDLELKKIQEILESKFTKKCKREVSWDGFIVGNPFTDKEISTLEENFCIGNQYEKNPFCCSGHSCVKKIDGIYVVNEGLSYGYSKEENGTLVLCKIEKVEENLDCGFKRFKVSSIKNISLENGRPEKEGEVSCFYNSLMKIFKEESVEGQKFDCATEKLKRLDSFDINNK